MICTVPECNGTVPKKMEGNNATVPKTHYWENNKGIIVDYMDSDATNYFKIEVGIPEWFRELIVKLFKEISNNKTKESTLKLLNSTPLRSENWKHIRHQLCVFILEKICKDVEDKIINKIVSDTKILHKTESTDTRKWSDIKSTIDSVFVITALPTPWSTSISSSDLAVLYIVWSTVWPTDKHPVLTTVLSNTVSDAWSITLPDVYDEILQELIRLFEVENH